MTSGSIAGGPDFVPASIAARCSASSSAVRSLAITSQSAKTSVPAMWSRCQWLSTTVNLSTPSATSASRIRRACGDRDAGVVDERFVPVDDRVARDPDLERALVHPVLVLGEPVPLDPSVVEREHAGSGAEDAELVDLRILGGP